MTALGRQRVDQMREREGGTGLAIQRLQQGRARLGQTPCQPQGAAEVVQHIRVPRVDAPGRLQGVDGLRQLRLQQQAGAQQVEGDRIVRPVAQVLAGEPGRAARVAATERRERLGEQVGRGRHGIGGRHAETGRRGAGEARGNDRMAAHEAAQRALSPTAGSAGAHTCTRRRATDPGSATPRVRIHLSIHPTLIQRSFHMSTDTADHARLWELIKDTRFGMFTHRHGDDGLLHSHPLTTQNRSVDEDATLYFFVPKDGVIAQHLPHDDAVNVAYANPDDDSYVSVAGRAALVDDDAMKRALFNSAAKAWFPAGADDPNLGLLAVRIESAEFWDVTESKVSQLLKIARAALTGDGRPQLGEHKKVDRP